jgi:hypothetical protein
MTLSAYISGIGVLGPGLANWPQTAAVLSEKAAYLPQRTLLRTPQILPPAERRRTGRVVQLALAVAVEAAASAGIDPAQMASVFSSSGGDGHNCHALCQALALASREISPTRFANSVHNAAAGYWSIATGAKLESNVLCAFDASFCAGLLEALTQVTIDEACVLLVAYDADYPEPIRSKRPVPDAFGAALVLTPHKTQSSRARIHATLGDDTVDTMSNSPLESLRTSVPAARCLPLLRQLASQAAGRSVLEYLDASRMIVQVEPCG